MVVTYARKGKKYLGTDRRPEGTRDMARHSRYQDDRDYREVRDNARGSWALTLAGIVVTTLGAMLIPRGESPEIVQTFLSVAIVCAGVALIYVGASLRKDSRRAQLRHDEEKDLW